MEKKQLSIKINHLNVRESISILLFRVIFLDFLAASLILIFFLPICQSFFQNTTTTWILSYNSFFFIILGLLKIGLTVFIILQWVNEYYEITPNAIYHRQGFIWREEKQFELEYVRTLKLSQGFFGKLFNYGTIGIYDIRGRQFLQLYQIHNPNKYIHILEGLITDPHEEKHTINNVFFGEDEESEDEKSKAEIELGPQGMK